MTAPNPFDAVVDAVLAAAGDMLGSVAQAAKGAASKPLPQIRGKRFDGVLYVHAGDVADALESQAPKLNARLIAKLRGAS